MRDYDWQIIVTLRRTLSVTKTAEMLFLSQPALTKRIKVIEDELGITLFNRNRPGARFTPEGERIADMAEKVIADIQAVKDEASTHNSGNGGRLRLGFPYSFVRYVLPQILKRYTESYPNVDAEIITMQSHELIKGVEDCSIDVCFARYGAEDSALERRLYSEDQAYVVCNRPFELEELQTMPFIDFTKNPGSSSALQRWWSERFSAPQNTRFMVTTSDACTSMIQNGLGYGFILDSRYFANDTDLYALPLEYLDGTKLTRKTWMFYRKESIKNPLVSNFLRISEEFAAAQTKV